MDYNRIKELLEKYIEGSTSLQEEKQLADYFTSESDIPEDLEYGKAMFIYFDHSARITYQKAKQGRIQTPFWITLAASFIILLGIGFLLMNKAGVLTPDDSMVVVNNFENIVKEVDVPSFGKIWLNKKSKISYPEKFSKNKNTIRITGEAYFELEKNNEDINIIADNASINPKAYSAFNLRSYRSSESIEITVQKGIIGVSYVNDKDGPSILVKENDYCSLHKETKFIYVSANLNENYLAWKTGKFHFNDLPMATVTDILARYYDVEVEYAEKSLAYCIVSGTYTATSLENILEGIQSATRIRINNTGKKIHILDGDCS